MRFRCRAFSKGKTRVEGWIPSIRIDRWFDKYLFLSLRSKALSLLVVTARSLGMNFPGRYVFGLSKHVLSRDLTEDTVDFGHANWIAYVFVRFLFQGWERTVLWCIIWSQRKECLDIRKLSKCWLWFGRDCGLLGGICTSIQCSQCPIRSPIYELERSNCSLVREYAWSIWFW